MKKPYVSLIIIRINRIEKIIWKCSLEEKKKKRASEWGKHRKQEEA